MLLLHLARVSLEHNAVWLEYKFNLTKLFRTWSLQNLSFHTPGAALINYWLTHSCSHFEITTKPGIKKFFCLEFFWSFAPCSIQIRIRVRVWVWRQQIRDFQFSFIFLHHWYELDLSLISAAKQEDKREVIRCIFEGRKKEMAEVFIKSYQNIKISVGGVIQGGCTLGNEKRISNFVINFFYCFKSLLLYFFS